MEPTSVPTHSAETGTSCSTTTSARTTGGGGGASAREALPHPASNPPSTTLITNRLIDHHVYLLAAGSVHGTSQGQAARRFSRVARHGALDGSRMHVGVRIHTSTCEVAPKRAHSAPKPLVRSLRALGSRGQGNEPTGRGTGARAHADGHLVPARLLPEPRSRVSRARSEARSARGRRAASRAAATDWPAWRRSLTAGSAGFISRTRMTTTARWRTLHEYKAHGSRTEGAHVPGGRRCRFGGAHVGYRCGAGAVPPAGCRRGRPTAKRGRLPRAGQRLRESRPSRPRAASPASCTNATTVTANISAKKGGPARRCTSCGAGWSRSSGAAPARG